MSNQRKLHAPSASSVRFEPGMKLHALAASRNLNGVFNAPKVASPAPVASVATNFKNVNYDSLTEEEKEEEDMLRAMFEGMRRASDKRRQNQIKKNLRRGGSKKSRRSKSRRSKSRHSKTRRSK